MADRRSGRGGRSLLDVHAARPARRRHGPADEPGTVNEPGALCWNELASRDTAAAKQFYGAVFGWGANTSPGPPMEYTEWMLGGSAIGGMMEMGPQMPAPGVRGVPAVTVPPHWLAYFAVDDCDASVAKISELGGAVHAGPMDIPAGRFAACADPQGATFGIVALSENR